MDGPLVRWRREKSAWELLATGMVASTAILLDAELAERGPRITVSTIDSVGIAGPRRVLDLLASLPALRSLVLKRCAGLSAASLRKAASLCRELECVDLSSCNDLKDSALPALGKLRSLRVLDVYNNSMTGDVPKSIRDLSNLNELYLANEHLLPLRRRYCGQPE